MQANGKGAIERAMVQKERWMLRAIDRGAIKGAMDDASDVSGSNRMDASCRS